MDSQRLKNKLNVYELILSKYSDHIDSNEEKSIPELRQLVNPYDPFLKLLKLKIIKDIEPFVYEKHFFGAVQKCIDYIKSIDNLELPISFFMNFKELDEFRAGPIMSQAILLCSLLRSLGEDDTKIYVTDKKIYVGFKYENESYLIDPESGSLLRGEMAENAFREDKLNYLFSDIYFESFEDD